MPDDKSKKTPAESSRINVNERYELDYWSERFSVSADKLKETVGKVGVMVKDVQAALRK